MQFGFITTNKELLDICIFELSHNHSPAFNDSLEKKAFFDQISRFPYKVELGTAFAHAYSQNPGFWDDESKLFDDCAEIMTYEMRRWQILNTKQPDFTLNEVLVSRNFNTYYELSRQPKKIAFNNLIHSLGLGYAKIFEPIDFEIDFMVAHEDIYSEFRGEFFPPQII